MAFIVKGNIKINSQIGNYNRALSDSAYFGGNDSIMEQEKANIEGIYITNGRIAILGNEEDAKCAIPFKDCSYCRYSDKKIIMAGAFTAFEGIFSDRKYTNIIATQQNCTPYEEGDGKNISSLHPSEIFIYRPDIILKTPEWMKRSKKVYQEKN